MTIEDTLAHLNQALDAAQEQLDLAASAVETDADLKKALDGAVLTLRQVGQELAHSQRDLAYREQVLFGKLAEDAPIDKALADARADTEGEGILVEQLEALKVRVFGGIHAEPELAELSEQDQALFEEVSAMVADYDQTQAELPKAPQADEADQIARSKAARQEADQERANLSTVEKSVLGLEAEIARLRAAFVEAHQNAVAALERGRPYVAAIHAHDAARQLTDIREALVQGDGGPFGAAEADAIPAAKDAWTAMRGKFEAKLKAVEERSVTATTARVAHARAKADRAKGIAQREATLAPRIEELAVARIADRGEADNGGRRTRGASRARPKAKGKR